MIEETLGEPIAAQLLQARATSDQQSELIRAQAEEIKRLIAKRDALLKAWSGFPGRSCAEAEWNAWILRMNRAVIETPPQGKA